MGASGKTHTPDLSVPAIIGALQGPTVSVAEALAEGGIPAAEGFYAWWASKKTLPEVPVYPHPNEPWRLLYIGIAPGRDPATRRSQSPPSTIRSRVTRQHIGGNTGSSTLKLALAALLVDERGYRPRRRSKKVVLDRTENLDLTEWQKEHLRLTWAVRTTPWKGTLEAAVIAQMRPPLNWQHNQAHPFWPTLDAARTRFRTMPGI